MKSRSSFLLLLISLAAACGSDRTPKRITESREISVKPGDEKVDATTPERFGNGFGGHGAGAMGAPGGGSAMAMPGPGLSAADFTWTTPPGWSELPPTPYRIVYLCPAKNPEADCYLSVAGGGVPANVNRWLGQFGAAALDDDTIAALPKQKLLGSDGVRVEVEGTFTTAMPGAAPVKKENFKLLGLIADAGGQQLVVKMTGPKAVVDQERNAFDAFVASLRQKEAGTPRAATTRGAANGAGGADPHAANGGFDPSKLKYDAPAGWAKQPDKPMRVVTFKPANTTSSECAVSVFGGDAGGLANNVQRWRGQMGLADLPAAEITKLPKLTVLGKEATVVDLLGKLTDSMTNRTIESARFLGVICPLDGSTLFVKLTGPEAEVTAAKEAFVSFCQSLRQ